jgi:hypothetical protein
MTTTLPKQGSTLPMLPRRLDFGVHVSPFPFLHHLRELFEQIMRVMWARRGFRVILHAEQGQVPMPQAFESVVIQVDVRKFDFAVRK